MSQIVLAAEQNGDAAAAVAFGTGFLAPVFAYRRGNRLYRLSCTRAAVKTPLDLSIPIRIFLQEKSEAWAIVTNVRGLTPEELLALAVSRTLERLTYHHENPSETLNKVLVVVRRPTSLLSSFTSVVDPADWRLSAAKILCDYARTRSLKVRTHDRKYSSSM